MTKTNLIIALIKADMKNHKLIRGLDEAGALVEDFYLSLDGIIMDELGFSDEEQEEAYELYSKKMRQLEKLPLSSFLQNLNANAQELYIELLAEKKYFERLQKS